MAKYTVTSRRTVAGHQPGDTVDDKDLAEVNVAALIAGGHLSPLRSKPVSKVEATPAATENHSEE